MFMKQKNKTKRDSVGTMNKDSAQSRLEQIHVFLATKAQRLELQK